MAIATRYGVIAAHYEAIRQLQELSSEHVSGVTDFGTYREALPVEEAVVTYTGNGQQRPSTVSVKVGEVTEKPHNKSGTQLALPYSNAIFNSNTGFGPNKPPAGILVVEDSPTYHRVWIRLPEQEEWKACQGSAESWKQ